MTLRRWALGVMLAVCAATAACSDSETAADPVPFDAGRDAKADAIADARNGDAEHDASSSDSGRDASPVDGGMDARADSTGNEPD